MTDRQVLSPQEFWRKYEGIEARLTAPLSERMLDLAGVGPGKRVLDLATGPGEPALRAARRVAPDGVVVGLDLDDGALGIPRDKARQRGIANLDLRTADAAGPRQVPSNHFHAATVRWGLMYMSAPVAALMNAHEALLPSGVLVAALWAEPDRVPYYTLPRRLLQRYRSVPGLDLDAPGPFRYADPARLARDFGKAGFALDHVEEMDVPVFEAEDTQRAWALDLAAELRRTAPEGPLRLGGVTRIVRARRNG